MTWYYRDKEFTTEMINGYYGFVYIITNIKTGRKYIGRKYFFKKMTKPPKAGRKRKRRFIVDSNWVDYYGSCVELLEDIKKHGKENFRRDVISLHKTRGQVNYSEIREQFCRDVLYSTLKDGTREYYNSNIMSRYFYKKI